jgi:hypothetical protein
MLAYKLRTMQSASEVDSQHLVPIFNTTFEKTAKHDDTGVVDKDIDPLELFENCADKILNLRAVANVSLNSDAPATEAADVTGSGLPAGGDVSDSYVSAFLRKTQRNSSSNAPCTTRD